MIVFCYKPIQSTSKYASVAQKRCHLPKGHDGKCSEFPFLSHLSKTSKRVADKIRRDATMTTGAAWKSKDAGPNRIPRWIMLLPDDDLKEFGIDMSALRPNVVAKLREKAASYDECVEVAIKLTWLAYQMPNAATPPQDVKEYLEEVYGEIVPASTQCEICLLPLSFNLFTKAKRGISPIETCHKDPRLHQADNVGFAHRRCNIAQGPMSLDQFYDWIKGILSRARLI